MKGWYGVCMYMCMCEGVVRCVCEGVDTVIATLWLASWRSTLNVTNLIHWYLILPGPSHYQTLVTAAALDGD